MAIGWLAFHGLVLLRQGFLLRRATEEKSQNRRLSDAERGQLLSPYEHPVVAPQNARHGRADAWGACRPAIRTPASWVFLRPRS